MDPKKTELRNQLFEKYFEEEGDIELLDLIQSMSHITETWQKLHKLLEKHVKYFDFWSSIEEIKEIFYNQTPYLIIYLGLLKYIIIDLSSNHVLTTEEMKNTFTEEFFIENFKEDKEYIEMCEAHNYDGEIEEIIEFYKENKETFEIPPRIRIKYEIEDAFTYLSIDLTDNSSQMGFQTPDQFLYEHLFFGNNLLPNRLQDSITRIGEEKSKEIFLRIQEIKAPIRFIPPKLYQEYLKVKKEETKQLTIQRSNLPM